MIKGKWLQLLSFFSMLIIFIAVVGCDEGDKNGICSYRNELMISGAALMMGLMGMRIANRKKNKKPKVP